MKATKDIIPSFALIPSVRNARARKRQYMYQISLRRIPLLLLVWLVQVSFVVAQPNPFGPATPTTPGPSRPSAPAPVSQDPVIRAIDESNPTTPSELTRAMRAMMNLGRPQDAKRYLGKLLATSPDEATLAALHQEYGSSFFFRLLRYQPLAPEGVALARSATDAAYKAAREPSRLQTLVRDLSDPSYGIRQAAFRGLSEAGDAAVEPMVQALADGSRNAEHKNIRDALVALGRDVIEPLIGVLQSSDDALVAQAISVLGRSNANRAVLYMIRPFASPKSNDALRDAATDALRRIVGEVPTKYDAREFLSRRANAYFNGQLPRPENLAGLIELWHWDDAKKVSVLNEYIPEASSLIVASQLAGDLLEVDPGNKEALRLYLAATLESAKLIRGLDRPLDDALLRSISSEAKTEALEDVLRFAVKNDHVPAAIGAAEALGASDDVTAVRSDDGRPRILAAALQHPDRRLRFAAASAIFKLDPHTGYPGSSRLAETLGFFIRTAGDRRILVGDPRVEHARSLVGILAESGIVANMATNGREFFKLASSDPDYDFLLMSDAVDFPHFKEVVQTIRKDTRTANLPIGLLVDSHKLEEMKHFAAGYDMVDAFPWPYENATLSLVIERLVQHAGRRMVSPEEKIAQASAALDAMIRFVENPNDYGFYDVMRHGPAIVSALDHPNLSAKAVTVLGRLGTAQAQSALIDFASQNARPIEQRQAAAAGFDAAVKRRGTMLTSQQIRDQYDRYNKSETLDAETQAVLGSILDTIEAKRNEQEREAELRRKASRSSPD